MSAITQPDQLTEHEFDDELMDEALDRSESAAVSVSGACSRRG